MSQALTRVGAAAPRLAVLGRTGSLFTRVALIFAEEARVDYELVILEDLRSTDAAAYSGNPALRIPVLRLPDQDLFGSQNICRVLAARSTRPLSVVWPENLTDTVAMNAQELVRQSMAAQVHLLMATDIGKRARGDAFVAKTLAGLEGSLLWLDRHATEFIATLPLERTLSMLEVELFCLLEHLKFGPTVPIDAYRSLLAFACRFGTRPSAQRTAFR
ncbi:MAG TPA: glutathione S-transferase N-terminal domain-containing protein [Allosphingosinicella sp.]|nr:glutathione S-transferase N-terminal domain-containing protein [Allosphingosinicella sp.]